jgi:uncharacterized protein YndB with AHSA1/START domain
VIRWPVRYDPTRAPVHVANEIDVAAPPEAVWAWLVAAPLWPSWYPNASEVVLAGGASELGPDVTFTWRTFGVAIRSTVVEFEPSTRIAWNAFGLGVDAYHAWEITRTAGGSHILTEETQYGWAARLGSVLFPNRMSNGHQLWLERLSAQARGGPPPSV